MSSEKSITSEEPELEWLEEPVAYDEPVPDWHIQIIDERLARYRADGIKGTPWEELEKRLIDQLIGHSLKD